MPLLERILTMGITGSGKSWQWLQLARSIKSTGAKFRAIDTDNDIDYMLHTQFPDLLPENGGNVYVHPAFDWPEYKRGVYWLTNKLNQQQLIELGKYDPNLVKAYKEQIVPQDWIIVDKINNAWKTVQRYFVGSVFSEEMGEYFLEVRRELHARGDIGKSGKKAKSILVEGMDGWLSWPVVNRLYDDWINPIVYRVRCNVYAATDVEEISKDEKNPEIISLFGDYKVKPSGQKSLGGQFHTIFLYIPGRSQWRISTVKDRADRQYFDKTPLRNLYLQYLVAKAGWPLIE